MALTVTWRPSGPVACQACHETVYPHEAPVVVGELAFHPACHRRGPVLNVVEVARGHREDREARVRRAVLTFLGLRDDTGQGRAGSDMLREARDLLKLEVPETLRVLDGHREIGSDAAWEIAKAEMEGENPECGRRWVHVADTLLSGEIHHRPFLVRCHFADHFACWRSEAEAVLDRHEPTIDALLEEGRLFVLEVPWPATAVGGILRDRLEAWVRFLNRQLGRKPTYLAWAAPDRLVVLLEIREGVRLGSEPVRSWDELDRIWKPIVPFNLACPEEGASDVYKASKKGCRLLRGRGRFFRSARPKTRTVKTTDDAGAVRKTSMKVCVCGCGQPVVKRYVAVLDAGRTCPHCPGRSERNQGKLDRFVMAGPGPPA